MTVELTYIKHNYKTYALGMFQEAGYAYDRKALEEPKLNFPIIQSP